MVIFNAKKLSIMILLFLFISCVSAQETNDTTTMDIKNTCNINATDDLSMSCVSTSKDINDASKALKFKNNIDLISDDDVDNESEVRFLMGGKFQIKDIEEVNVVVSSIYNGTFKAYIDYQEVYNATFDTLQKFKLNFSKYDDNNKHLFHFEFDFGTTNFILNHDISLVNSTYYFNFSDPYEADLKHYIYEYDEIFNVERIKIENFSYDFLNNTLKMIIKYAKPFSYDFNKQYLMNETRNLYFEIERDGEVISFNVDSYFEYNYYELVISEFFDYNSQNYMSINLKTGNYKVTVSDDSLDELYTNLFTIPELRNFDKNFYTNNFSIMLDLYISFYKNTTLDVYLDDESRVSIPVNSSYEFHNISFHDLLPGEHKITFSQEGDENCPELFETFDVLVEKGEPVLDIGLPIINDSDVEFNIFSDIGGKHDYLTVSIGNESQIIEVEEVKTYKVYFKNLESGIHEVMIEFKGNDYYNELLLSYAFEIIGDNVEEFYNKTEDENFLNESSDDNDNESDIDDNDSDIGDGNLDNITGQIGNETGDGYVLSNESDVSDYRNESVFVDKIYNIDNIFDYIDKYIGGNSEKYTDNNTFSSIGKSNDELSHDVDSKSYEISKKSSKSIHTNQNNIAILIVMAIVTLMGIFVYLRLFSNKNDNY